MKLTEKDAKVIQSIIEELCMYRQDDEEPREMTIDNLYSDEIELVKKLGITIEV